MPQHRAESFVLAIDIGSSSTRSGIFDQRGRPLPGSQAAQSYSIRYSANGAAELSPLILRRAATRCIARSLNCYEGLEKNRRAPILAISGSAFWHGLLGLNSRGRPITPIYTWADSRAARAAARLKEMVSEPLVHQQTGCRLHTSFWPAKLVWLREGQPRLFRRVARWVSPCDWIFSELFHITGSSPSMASGTGLYDRYQNAWDKKLCARCGVDPSALPMIVSSETAPHGISNLKLHPCVFLPLGDGAASNLGSGAEAPGVVAINVGTSAAVRMVRRKKTKKRAKVPFGLFEYVVDLDRFLIGGAVSNAGNLRQWALRELRLNDTPSTNRLIYSRTAAVNDELTALPFWAGERAPTWPDQQFGIIDSIRQSTKATDIIRALTCSAYYRLADILDGLAASQGEPLRLIVSGGVLKSPPAVKLLADCLGRDVEMSSVREASLRGAAVFALQRLGHDVAKPRNGRRIQHSAELARQHNLRRQRQKNLEETLSGRI